VAATKKTLWELLWDYDPNGLVVVDPEMLVTVVNPAFCKMFRVEPEEIIGRPAVQLLGNMADFYRVWENDEVIRGKEEAYLEYDLYVKKLLFSIKDEQVIACIMVDLTSEWHQKNEMLKLKLEAIEKVNRVVDNQMKVVQEIAGLLGETTAETKVSLLKLVQMIEQEIV
jgi:PAS domain S-box-containing protein